MALQSNVGKTDPVRQPRSCARYFTALVLLPTCAFVATATSQAAPPAGQNHHWYVSASAALVIFLVFPVLYVVRVRSAAR